MLIKCKECGHEISDSAMTCPHCGFYRGLKCSDCAHWYGVKGSFPWCHKDVGVATAGRPACEQFTKRVVR